MGLTIYTGGTFDLFHSGHVQFLRRCADLAYRKATPARQGRMTPEQKARVAAAHDFLILVTSEIQQ